MRKRREARRAEAVISGRDLVRGQGLVARRRAQEEALSQLGHFCDEYEMGRL